MHTHTHTRARTLSCLSHSVFLAESAKVLTFRNANCFNSSLQLHISFQLHLWAPTQRPPSPPVHPAGGADQTVKRPMADPSVLLLVPGPGGHASPLNTSFYDHLPDPGVRGRGWRWAKPVKGEMPSHWRWCFQKLLLKRRMTSLEYCVSAEAGRPTAGLHSFNATARRGRGKWRKGRGW